MHIISKRPFNEAAQKHPANRDAILHTYHVLNGNEFVTPNALRCMFPSLDNFKYKDKWWIIDIGGNNLRLMAAIQFVHQRMYIKHIVTHTEYDKLCRKYKKEQD